MSEPARRTESPPAIALETPPARGLTEREAAARLARYGPNALVPERHERAWRRLLRPLADPMVLILLGAGAVFFGLGDSQNGLVMLVAILPVVLVDVVLERRAEGALRALRAATSPRVEVVREGRRRTVPVEALVPGDVVLLKEGDIVPSDGLLVEASDLQVDESALTGESHPIAKVALARPVSIQDVGREKRVFAGTTILSGRGTFVVKNTGSGTAYGQIGALVARIAPTATPIQRAIGQIVRTLGVVAAGLFVAVIALQALRGQPWSTAFLGGVSLAIAAIPEEFPIVFTIYLTFGAWRMARLNVLVRRLAGVETLGSTTVICADKTGTLTEGRMAIGALYDGENVIFVEGAGRACCPSTGGPKARRLIQSALLACEPNPYDPLEQAIARYAGEIGEDADTLYKRWTLVQEYPFDPEQKYVTHIWRSHEGRLLLCAKGAIEGILDLSSASEHDRQEALDANLALTGRGMRVIAVAGKELRRLSGARWVDEAGLRFLGLIGLTDPPRASVRTSVAECQSAGIRVVMITGDHPLTAHSVAESVGLAHRDEDIITGAELEQLSDDELDGALRRVAIFARTMPAQKYLIVRGLKKLGEVVAMTGDGINDAPALKEADIGVAMGRRGTEVARAAATMVLLDDNFRTIVAAVREGRRIFENMRRAFDYLVGFHLPILLLALALPLLGAPLLLLPIHLVWLEIILHPTSALVFEADPANPQLMQRPPRRPQEPFLRRGAVLRVVAEGTVIFAGTLGLYIWALGAGRPVEEARGAALAALVLAQTILVLGVRSPEKPLWQTGLAGNRVLPAILAATLASLLVVMYVPAIATATRLAGPTPSDWLLAIGAALGSTMVFEIGKLGGLHFSTRMPQRN